MCCERLREKTSRKRLGGLERSMENHLDDEPLWLNPENDRKKPYTDEEIEELVNGYIQEFPEHYAELMTNDGPNTARIILRNRFRSRDDNRIK